MTSYANIVISPDTQERHVVVTGVGYVASFHRDLKETAVAVRDALQRAYNDGREDQSVADSEASGLDMELSDRR